jgi:cytochrome c-type biogenesis protein CcmH
MTRRLFLALMVLVASFVAASLVQAQEGFPSDDDVNAIARKLYCPVCPNTPLDVCETSAPTRLWTYVKPRLARTGGPR